MGILTNKLFAFLFLCLISMAPHLAADEAIIVVANTPNKSMHLNQQQIRNLFMGGFELHQLKAIALLPENQTRVVFNTKVVGLTESRIQSYWAQMRFTGRKKPPIEISNEERLLEHIQNNEFAVGYLPASTPIPEGLTIIYTVR